jgi:hypothetical protein
MRFSRKLFAIRNEFSFASLDVTRCVLVVLTGSYLSPRHIYLHQQLPIDEYAVWQSRGCRGDGSVFDVLACKARPEASHRQSGGLVEVMAVVDLTTDANF